MSEYENERNPGYQSEHRLAYVTLRPARGGGAAPRRSSAGSADGAPGGDGVNADIVHGARQVSN